MSGTYDSILSDSLNSKIPDDKVEAIRDLISGIISSMGIDSKVVPEENSRYHIFNIASPDSKLLIGQRGANLFALQSLVQNAALRKLGVEQRFALDVDDYKRKREWFLRETAKRATERVIKTGKPVTLEPMQAYERRIIHAYLSEGSGFDTESVGKEPKRRIVIKLKSKDDIF